MRFLDLIEAKKRGDALAPDRWSAAIRAIVAGGVPDYQIAALLMAVRWRGMDAAEAVALTEAMIDSGERWKFDAPPGPLVDKHSTGGVGDKVSLVLAPLAAACGCAVPMVSGRGLGHSGGTLDKLETIPGFRTDLSREAFARQLDAIGVAMGAQTEHLVPADRILYALRDATATVDEPGLITASILSKKIAEGASALVLDVKVGRGAFLGSIEATRELALRLLSTARGAGLATTALLTDMDQPLGRAVGNALEVREALACLRGEGPEALRQITLELTAEMLLLGGIERSRDRALQLATRELDAGAALEKFRDLIAAQGGDPAIVDAPDRLPAATDTGDLVATADGFLLDLDPLAVGRASVALRAGRDTREAAIDPGAGVVLHAVRGEEVRAGQPWATMHFGSGADLDTAARLLERAATFGDAAPSPRPLIIERHA
jgi:pyrimidine-nucleoside phosphorylase